MSNSLSFGIRLIRRVFFLRRLARYGASKMLPLIAPLRVPTIAMHQSMMTATPDIVPNTLKKKLGICTPNSIVQTANTPSGKVQTYQPILKGNGQSLWHIARAKQSHNRPNPHIISATKTPLM